LALAGVLATVLLLWWRTLEPTDTGTPPTPPNGAPADSIADAKPIRLLEADHFLKGDHLLLGQGKLTDMGQGVWYLESATRAMVELWPHVSWKRYRLRLEVMDLGAESPRQAGAWGSLLGLLASPGAAGPLVPASTLVPGLGAAREIGIYFDYQQLPNTVGMDQWYQKWSFSERPAKLMQPTHTTWRAETWVDAVRQWTPGKGTNTANELRQLFLPVKLPRWVKLEVEVTPETMCFFWDGGKEPFECIHQSKVRTNQEQQAAIGKFAPRTTPPQHIGQGGIGLHVTEGAALFRDVVLEPLVEKK
jgi:hypothetical protein